MLEKGIRGWRTFQALANEHGLKQYLREERAKGRGQSDHTVWSPVEMEERLDGLLQIGKDRIIAIRALKSSASKRAPDALLSPVDKKTLKLKSAQKDMVKKRASQGSGKKTATKKKATKKKAKTNPRRELHWE